VTIFNLTKRCHFFFIYQKFYFEKHRFEIWFLDGLLKLFSFRYTFSLKKSRKVKKPVLLEQLQLPQIIYHRLIKMKRKSCEINLAQDDLLGWCFHLKKTQRTSSDVAQTIEHWSKVRKWCCNPCRRFSRHQIFQCL